MPALVGGIVFDLSSSWIEHGGPERWMMALCETIKKLNYHLDPYITTSKDNVFAIGCGCKGEPYSFDILSTIRRLQDMEPSDGDDVDAILRESLDILKENGAPYVLDWANEKKLKQIVEAKDRKVLWHMLKTDKEFMKTFVYDVLPEECRSRYNFGTFVANEVKGSTNADHALLGARVGAICGAIMGQGVGMLFGAAFGAFIGYKASAAANDKLDCKTDESIMDTIRKGTDLVWNRILVPVTPESVMNVQDACCIVSGCTSYGNSETGETRANTTQAEQKMHKLLEKMKPLIYGDRQMVSALWDANKLLSRPNFNTYEQILFVMAGGPPDDQLTGVPDFETGEVTVVCATHNTHDSESRHLYSTESPHWDRGARFYFRLSSPIDTQRVCPPVGWTVESREPGPRLFYQISRPSSVEAVYTLAKDVVSSL